MRTRELDVRVHAPRAAFDLASRHAREALPDETGGILTGWRVGAEVVIDAFIEVRDHRATRRGYWRRENRASRALAEYLQMADNPALGYVGEWHSHPLPQMASRTDIASIRSIAKQVPGPVALVVLMIDPARGTVRADTRVAVHESLRTAVFSVPLDLR
ncbi:Mov34/MPN/PAD-1 family protein [Microbacterium flavescens]|uniref:Mov34/MPN/PAD-1 family protein n=1 Tax=Microbacterium flavescens TaxID=69366 RepID=UPI001BDE59A2